MEGRKWAYRTPSNLEKAFLVAGVLRTAERVGNGQHEQKGRPQGVPLGTQMCLHSARDKGTSDREDQGEPGVGDSRGLGSH